MNTKPTPHEHGTTRRSWLAGLTMAGLGLIGADKPPAPLKPDAVEIWTILERVKKAGLSNFRTTESEHFVGIGNAPDGFRHEALGVCEALYKTFRMHFQTLKIELTPLAHKMAVVILADAKSYEQFKGDDVEAPYGHYDVEANYLVTYKFDQRDRQAATYNTFTLVHEATHQLTYNTGLLARHADVPVAISEGFATYCEIWRVSGKVIGKVNAPWLNVLRDDAGQNWIPIARLITDDKVFTDEKTNQIAYAECWLLMYDLLSTKAGTLSLKTYLADLQKQHKPAQRVVDAEKAFGDLDRLDADLKKKAFRNLSRGRG